MFVVGRVDGWVYGFAVFAVLLWGEFEEEKSVCCEMRGLKGLDGWRVMEGLMCSRIQMGCLLKAMNLQMRFKWSR